MTYAENLKLSSEDSLKLSQQLINDCQIDALDAVEIARKQLNGYPIEVHIETTADHHPIFAITILKEDPLSIIEVRIDAKTGEIVDSLPLGEEKTSTFNELSFSGRDKELPLRPTPFP